MLLYHRTDAAAAERIIATRTWRSRENTGEVYLSTRGDAGSSATGYGAVTLVVDVTDLDTLVLDDEFPDGEQHYRVLAAALRGLPVRVHHDYRQDQP